VVAAQRVDDLVGEVDCQCGAAAEADDVDGALARLQLSLEILLGVVNSEQSPTNFAAEL
jgi:hypothetical protein